MQTPAILKEIKNPDSPFHIGGIGSFMQPLCEKFSENEMNILGWVSSRGWQPDDEFCPKCSEFYEKGVAWKLPSQRQ